MSTKHKIKPTIELYNRFSESVVNVYRFENRDALLDPDTGWRSMPQPRLSQGAHGALISEWGQASPAGTTKWKRNEGRLM